MQAIFSFVGLDNFKRSSADIEAASNKLNLDEDKMEAALFWFWKGNEISDKPALGNNNIRLILIELVQLISINELSRSSLT
jgi:hypothetical protein